MARRKERSKEDELEEENRHLKSIIRSLQKQIKKLSKGNRKVEELEELLKEDQIQKESSTSILQKDKRERCPKCKTGTLEEAELGKYKLMLCRGSGCNYRQRSPTQK